MSKLPVQYEPIQFKQLLVPSIIMLLGAVVLLLVSGYTLSWLGSLDLSTILTSMVVVVVTYAFIYWLTSHAWLNTKEMRQLNTQLVALFKGLTWPQIIALSICAGVGEELLFRGLLQTWLVAKLNPLWGILGASVVFGLMHYLNSIYIFLTFVLGCLFGVAYYLTDSLLLIMIAHAVYDIIAFGVIVKYSHLLTTESPSATLDA